MKMIRLLSRTLLVLTVLTLAVQQDAMAQLTESFESPTAPPANWKMIYEDPSPYVTGSSGGFYYDDNEMMHVDPDNFRQPPYSNPSYDTAYAGSMVFRFSSFKSTASGKYHQYLISPPLNVSAANDSVAFYYRQIQSNGDKFQLGWSTTTNDTSAFTFGPLVSTVSGGDQVWTLYSKNDLPLNTKYVCIKYGGNTARYMLYVDGFYGPPVANLDAGVVDFNAPAYPGTANLSVDFQNGGITTLNSVKINYQIDGGTVQQHTWNGTMIQDSLNQGYVIGNHNFTSGTHTIKVWTSDPNGGVDVNNNNDTIFETFVTVNDPTANAGSDADICAGDNYDITSASANNYSSLAWSTSGTGSFVNGNTLTASYLPSPADTVAGSVDLTLTAYGYPGHPDASSTITLTIHGTPSIDFSGLAANYCPNDADVTLTPTKSGGSFIGSGITGSTFSPSSVTPGVSYNIKYEYTDTYGCSNSVTKLTNVYSETSVTLTNLASQYCEDDSPVVLNGSPGSGSYTVSGSAMAGATFDPSAWSATSHTVEYSYTDGNGCTFTASQSTTINPLPTVTINGLSSDYCSNESAVTLNGTPSGGSFTIDGNPATQFDPTSLSVGTHNVVYTATNSTTACSNSTSQTVEIHAAPVADFSGLATEYCVDASPATLSGTPSTGTGTFTGPGTSGSTFDPASAGSGTHTITYTHVGTYCTVYESKTVTVNALPTVTNTTATTEVCEDGAAVTLSGNFSPAGSFTGTSVTGNQFDPVSAGVGIHAITYTYTDGNGCTNSDSKNIEVKALPTVSFSGLNADYCENDANATLSASPSGGSFSITGGSGIVNTNEFSPFTAGAGSYTVTYSYTNPTTGCTNTDDQNVTVNASPSVSLSGLDAEYCSENINDTLTGLPYNGTFTGMGMTDSIFNPGTVAGGSSYNITYTYTDPVTGCSGAITQSTLVRALPTLSFSGLQTEYCEGDASSLLVPNQTGGSFSGPGITASTFDPDVAGAGTHTISYDFTDTHGCSNSETQTTTVNALPVADFTGLASEYCESRQTVNLTGVNGTGSFTGTAVVGNQFSPANAGAGAYNITFTYTDANGCTDDTTKSVVVHGLPDASFTGLGSSYCREDGIDTLVPATSGGFFLGMGMNQDSLFNPKGAGTGYHDISYWVFDQNGCFDSTHQQVFVFPNPVASMSGLAGSYCEDAADVTLSGYPAGGTFGGTAVTGNVFSPQAAGDGNYQITYTFTNSFGCSDTKKRSVQIDSVPTVSFTGLNAEYCADDIPDTLQGTPAVTGGVFLGKGMDNNVFNPTDAQAGNWKIIYHVTTTAGCVNADTQYVYVKPLPDVYLGMDTVLCYGDSLELFDMNSSAPDYLWSTGSISDTIIAKPLMDSSFTLTATLNGCSKTDKINIMISDPMVDLGPDSVVCAGDMIKLDAGPGFETYLWSTGATTQTIKLDSAGIGLDSINVVLTVTDEYGCSVTDTILVDFDICKGIHEYTEEDFLVYPNPGSGLFTIEADFHHNDVVYVYDSRGRRILSTEPASQQAQLQLDLRGVDQGIYYLIIVKEKATISRKLIISR